MKKFTITLLAFTFIAGAVLAQEIPLYTGKIPNSKEVPNIEQVTFNAEVDSLAAMVSVPTISVFLPSKGKANGTAVIICPGGGYHVLLTKREGSDIARAFNKEGIAAIVLKYRLPNDRAMPDKAIAPLQDAQQAIRTVRLNAKKWNIDPSKIGIMGFSAGGHLAATAGTHFEKALIPNPEGISVRPDFMVLIYPVISFTDSIGHTGSRGNLIGNLEKGSAEQIKQIRYFSNEYHVNSQTPPTFITHASDDVVVPLANTTVFYEALKKNNVPSDLHIYSKGGHGYLKYPAFNEWFGPCVYWVKNSL